MGELDELMDRICDALEAHGIRKAGDPPNTDVAECVLMIGATEHALAGHSRAAFLRACAEAWDLVEEVTRERAERGGETWH